MREDNIHFPMEEFVQKAQVSSEDVESYLNLICEKFGNEIKRIAVDKQLQIGSVETFVDDDNE